MRKPLLQIVLGISTVTAAVLGLWATFAPRSFYDDFPGGGRHWVSLNGPYNEHFIRDFGSLQLALAVVTGVALVSLVPLLVRTAAVAGLAFSVPHLVYHLRHIDVYSSTDKVVNAVSLTGAVVFALVALALSGSARGPEQVQTGEPASPGATTARSGS
jgi:hypothetical protein